MQISGPFEVPGVDLLSSLDGFLLAAQELVEDTLRPCAGIYAR